MTGETPPQGGRRWRRLPTPPQGGRRWRRLPAAFQGGRRWRRLPAAFQDSLAHLSWADLCAPLVLLAVAWLYTWHLSGNRLLSDDEGGYLYAAWRIGLGELPYCDFLTPQLPGFLLPGGLLFRLTGPDFVVARLLAVAATLGAGVLLWATTRRLFGPAVALTAGALLVLHPDVFLAGRVFRADSFMLFLAMLGVALFFRGAFPRPGAIDPPQRRWLVAAGLAFGLATITKLFGPFLLGGCLLWLGLDAWRRGRPWPAVGRDGLALLLPSLLVVGLGLGLFAARGCDVYGSVVGHHLQQGAGMAWGQVMAKGLGFFATFLRYNENALLFFVAIVAGLGAWRSGHRPAMAFACLLPTALAFLLLSRELFARHLNYLLPAVTTLFALAMAWLALAMARENALLRRGLPVALAGALVFAWWLTDRDMAWQQEDGTQRVADFIQLVTEPGDWVLADNSELNFWALRPTTYTAASLSAGATGSGQITWARIQGELEAASRLPALVLVDRTNVDGYEYGHFRFLHDLPAFDRWRDQHFDHDGPFQRSGQRLEVHTPKDHPLPIAARFAAGPTLLAAGPVQAEVAAGQPFDFRSAWQAGAPPTDELVATLRLVDGRGVEWRQVDESLLASPGRTTDQWVPGELTSTRVRFGVPAGTPPGAYDLRLGLYRRGSDEPLEVANAAGAVLGASAGVGTIRVVAGGTLPARRLPLAAAVDVAPAAGLRLLGRGPVATDAVLAGTVFPLELWWETAGVVQDVAARVTLSDPGIGAIAADKETPLGVPGTSPSAWPPGPFTVRQLVRVPVHADARGGTYALSVTLVDAEGQAVAGAEQVHLGALTVTPRDLGELQMRAPDMGQKVAATIGDLAEMAGADLPAGALPGANLAIRLAWHALASSEQPLKVTVQLLDDAGRPIAQHDGEPANARRPTTGWLPGEYVLDAHNLAIPLDAAAGAYTVIAAVYDPATGARLPVSGADGLGDAVRLGTVTVRGR